MFARVSHNLQFSSTSVTITLNPKKNLVFCDAIKVNFKAFTIQRTTYCDVKGN